MFMILSAIISASKIQDLGNARGFQKAAVLRFERKNTPDVSEEWFNTVEPECCLL